MSDMTHSYLGHDSFICDTFLCITHIHMCDMTHVYVWRYSFVCRTWLIHTWHPAPHFCVIFCRCDTQLKSSVTYKWEMSHIRISHVTLYLECVLSCRGCTHSCAHTLSLSLSLPPSLPLSVLLSLFLSLSLSLCFSLSLSLYPLTHTHTQTHTHTPHYVQAIRVDMDTWSRLLWGGGVGEVLAVVREVAERAPLEEGLGVVTRCVCCRRTQRQTYMHTDIHAYTHSCRHMHVVCVCLSLCMGLCLSIWV